MYLRAIDWRTSSRSRSLVYNLYFCLINVLVFDLINLTMQKAVDQHMP